jgi:hypothetical protein
LRSGAICFLVLRALDALGREWQGGEPF